MKRQHKRLGTSVVGEFDQIKKHSIVGHLPEHTPLVESLQEKEPFVDAKGRRGPGLLSQTPGLISGAKPTGLRAFAHRRRRKAMA